MPQLVLSRGTDYKRSLLKRLFPKVELGPYFLLVSLVVFVGLITVITLMFSARQVTKGYVLNSLEAHHQEIAKESERRDMEISKVRSLNFIQESSKVRRMVRPDVVAFMDSDTAIAKR
ncbi:MAG: hypothetical protein V1679_00945 [Candidatus Peregrinibacteria bacterium]